MLIIRILIIIILIRLNSTILLNLELTTLKVTQINLSMICFQSQTIKTEVVFNFHRRIKYVLQYSLTRNIDNLYWNFKEILINETLVCVHCTSIRQIEYSKHTVLVHDSNLYPLISVKRHWFLIKVHSV